MDDAAVVHGDSDRKGKVGHTAFEFLLPVGIGGSGCVNEAVSGAGEAVEQMAGGVRLQALGQERRPVIRGDVRETSHDVVEGVGLGDGIAEECAREVGEGFLSRGSLPNQGVDIKPQKNAFAVVVFAPLPVSPGHGVSGVEERVVIAVLQGLPGSAEVTLGCGCVDGKKVERVLLCDQPRARRKRERPELCLALVDPEQAVAHGQIEIRCPEIRRLAIEAVPGVRIFVGEERDVGQVGSGVSKEVFGEIHFARFEMLEATAAGQVIAQADQKIVMAVVSGMKHVQRLLDHRSHAGQLSG